MHNSVDVNVQRRAALYQHLHCAVLVDVAEQLRLEKVSLFLVDKSTSTYTSLLHSSRRVLFTCNVLECRQQFLVRFYRCQRLANTLRAHMHHCYTRGFEYYFTFLYLPAACCT